MKIKILLPLVALSVLATGCVTSSAPGSDTAKIAAARSQPNAVISQDEITQYRRQRSNVSEELLLEEQKRRNNQRQIDGNLGTINNVMGTINRAKWLF